MPLSFHPPGPRIGLVVLLLLLLPAAAAQPDIEITRASLLPAGELRGGDFVLRGTAGQATSGRAEASGLRLQGGFHRAARSGQRIFLDGFESRNSLSISHTDTRPEDPT